jgi:hypothetical protein
MHTRHFSHAFAVLSVGCLAAALTSQSPVQFGTNFYEFVPAGITWQNAMAAAASRVFLGTNGHLATVTSAAENAFLVANYGSYGAPTGIWLAGQVDAGGTGRWMAGPETNQVFSQGQTPVGGAYANWGGIEPNNAPSFTWMNVGPGFAGIAPGQWADDDDGVPSGADPVIGYFVEYESPRWRGLGVGCAGTGGIPALTATTPPDLGQQFSLALSHLPPAGGLFAMAIGFSDTVLPGFGALPFEFAAFGAPSCYAWCDIVSTDFRIHAGPSATYDIHLPNVPAYAGLVFFQQAYVFDAPANALGATTTNGGRAVVQ